MIIASRSGIHPETGTHEKEMLAFHSRDWLLRGSAPRAVIFRSTNAHEVCASYAGSLPQRLRRASLVAKRAKRGLLDYFNALFQKAEFAFMKMHLHLHQKLTRS